MNTTVN